MTRLAATRTALLLTPVLLIAWYCIAANYGYGVVSGSYAANFPGGTSSIILKKDHSFEQRVTLNQRELHAAGTWELFGEASIGLSGGFHPLPGEDVAASDGEYYGEFRKRFGLLVYIQMNPSDTGPISHRTYFPRMR